MVGLGGQGRGRVLCLGELWGVRVRVLLVLLELLG